MSLTKLWGQVVLFCVGEEFSVEHVCIPYELGRTSNDYWPLYENEITQQPNKQNQLRIDQFNKLGVIRKLKSSSIAWSSVSLRLRTPMITQ